MLAACVVYGSFILSLVFVYASFHNYHGAYALKQLHSMEQSETTKYVHMDTSATMNGVSRFLYDQRLHWRLVI